MLKRLEENKDFRAYRYGDRLEPGHELKIEHSISCEDVDISPLIRMGKESLEAMRQGSIDGEQKAYEIVVAAAKQWEQQAASTQMIDRALEYLRTPEVEHTGNVWEKSDGCRDSEQISNRVYKMSCSIKENTKHDRETDQRIPVAWHVTWDLYVNSPKQGYGEKIAGQNQKRYTDKAAALKYQRHLTVHGALLPGYTVEGQEPVKTDRTAAEVSEGGISMPEKAEKPSVLGKLSEAKRDAKESGQPVRKCGKGSDV